MPKTLFFDCVAGAEGDLLIGSLLDAGLDAERWQAELAKIAMPAGSNAHTIRMVDKNGIVATKFTVFVDGHEADVWPEEEHPHLHAPHAHSHEHRGLPEIEAILDSSPIAPEA